MIWFMVFYFTKDDEITKKRTYIRASNLKEARRVAELRLAERYIEPPTIVEVRAI